MDGGDSADGLGGDGIAYGAGHSHAETTNDGVGEVQDHVPEAHDSDQMKDFGYNDHDLDVCRMETEGGDCTESDGENRIYVSRGMEVAHHPMLRVSSGENVNAVVGESVNGEKEGTGDSSIGSQALVSLVHLGSYGVYCSCFYSLQSPKQKDLISQVDALSSPGRFSPSIRFYIKGIDISF